MTAGARTKEHGDWIELHGRKRDGFSALEYAKAGRGNGSEGIIMNGGQRQPRGRSDSRMAIQKTIHYSVEHSKA